VLVGTSLADITPPEGASLAGYFHVRRATGVDDPLHAKALVVGGDEEALGLVVFDLIGVGRQEVEQIRGRAHESCGIAPARVMVAATHTHLAPVTVPIFQSECDPQWLAGAVEKGAEAIAEAWHAREEREFSIATGRVESIAFNRRYWMRSGAVRMNPGVCNPDIVRPAGPIDPEVGVLAWGPPDKPSAILVNYTCHLDTISGDRVSADYPAYMAAAIRDRLGDVAVMFVNGAFGNINHVDVNDPSPRKGLEQAKWMGEVLAAEVLRVLPQAAGSESQQLDEAHRLLDIPLRPLPDDAVASARATLASAPPVGEMNPEQMCARETVLLAESEKPEVTAEVQALRIGEAALVGLPGEPFVELGLRLKGDSPFPHTYVVGLGNGCEGYIPTRAAFDEGGYEVRTARSSKLHPDAEDMMVAAGSELLNQLREAK